MSETKPVLVSACLLGRPCRYDGRHNHDAELEGELARRGEQAIPFCPEEAGGLGTPRPPAWLTAAASRVRAGAGSVVTEVGRDVTREFRAGAAAALARCRELDIERAYLKERSPSCGVASTHVDGEVVPGPGVTTETLRAEGIDTVGVEGRRS